MRLSLPLAHCHLGKLIPPLMNQHQLSLQLNCMQALVGQDQLGWANAKTQSDCTMRVCQTHSERHTHTRFQMARQSESQSWLWSQRQTRSRVGVRDGEVSTRFKARAGPDRCSPIESPRRSAQSQRNAKQEAGFQDPGKERERCQIISSNKWAYPW